MNGITYTDEIAPVPPDKRTPMAIKDMPPGTIYAIDPCDEPYFDIQRDHTPLYRLVRHVSGGDAVVQRSNSAEADVRTVGGNLVRHPVAFPKAWIDVPQLKQGTALTRSFAHWWSVETDGNAHFVGADGKPQDEPDCGFRHDSNWVILADPTARLAEPEPEVEPAPEPTSEPTAVDKLTKRIVELESLLVSRRQEHVADIQRIGERLIEAASDHDLCSVYDDVIDDINCHLHVELPQRRKDRQISFVATLTEAEVATFEEAIDRALKEIGASACENYEHEEA